MTEMLFYPNNPQELQPQFSEYTIFSFIKSPNQGLIQQGMAPSQISEIVSDHLIDVVKKQFELIKQEYQSELPK